MEEKNYTVRDFQHVIEIGSINAIKSLTGEGCGVTFLYEAAVKHELESGTLRVIPLSDFEEHHNFTLVWRKNSMFFDRYLDIFDELLRK